MQPSQGRKGYDTTAEAPAALDENSTSKVGAPRTKIAHPIHAHNSADGAVVTALLPSRNFSGDWSAIARQDPGSLLAGAAN
jgi:hypothetical protein